MRRERLSALVCELRRLGAPADCHVISESSVRLAALADAPGAFSSTLVEWTGSADTEQRWRGRLATVALNAVLTLEDQPAGMVSATAPGRDGAVELISLWVAPFARGHGVGDAATNCVVEWARVEYSDASVVLSVKADNTPATHLYGRHGFTDAGPSPDDPTERLMRKQQDQRRGVAGS